MPLPTSTSAAEHGGGSALHRGVVEIHHGDTRLLRHDWFGQPAGNTVNDGAEGEQEYGQNAGVSFSSGSSFDLWIDVRACA
jgi:hypothetical protein